MLFLKANLKSIDARNTYVQISTVIDLGIVDNVGCMDLLVHFGL